MSQLTDAIHQTLSEVAERITTLAVEKAAKLPKPCCLQCLHFNEAAEACTGYAPHPAFRPPARVIAYGCEKFHPSEPF